MLPSFQKPESGRFGKTVRRQGRAAGQRLRKRHSTGRSGPFRRNGAHGGVGLAGMRERIHELGGQLEMNSGQPRHPGGGHFAAFRTKRFC